MVLKIISTVLCKEFFYRNPLGNNVAYRNIGNVPFTIFRRAIIIPRVVQTIQLILNLFFHTFQVLISRRKERKKVTLILSLLTVHQNMIITEYIG